MKKLNLKNKRCLECGKEIVLNVKRDIERKKFCSHSCRARYYVKNGTIKLTTIRLRGNPNPPRGKNHRWWKGGYKNSQGYRFIKIGIHKGEYEAEHRIVMEKYLGRKLKRNEIIHHIDGNRLNNKIDNLILCSLREHFKIHYSLMKIAFKMVENGNIKFNKETKTYAF